MRVGLTGGIGSGKTTVARMFAALDAPVIDADEIAHRLTRPGQPATAKILDIFGPDIADNHGINRQSLAQRIFASPDARRQLESILHPPILATMEQEAREVTAPYCLLVLPLLIEAGLRDRVDRVLVVEADENIRIQRVQARDRRDPEQIRSILYTQAGTAQRDAVADDRIINNGDLAALQSQVAALHARYLAIAGGSTPAMG
jgi:dephospho-CoA kinase